jgi:hypothetical protein
LYTVQAHQQIKRLLDIFYLVYKTKEAKSLLRKDWFKANLGAPHSTGFCYIAAEAAFHLLGGKSNGLNSYCAVYLEDGEKCTHWWLKNDTFIIDPTDSQYFELGLKPPYHLGKRAGFLTKQPSKRAMRLMEMVLYAQQHLERK